MSAARVLPRARLPTWRQPVAFPWMGARGLEAASGRAHTATACHLPGARPAHWPYGCLCGVAAAAEGSSPSSAGPGAGAVSFSLGRSRHARACLALGGCFLGGSCVAWASATRVASRSFLRPLGSSLCIFSVRGYHEATSAMPFVARQGPCPLP